MLNLAATLCLYTATSLPDALSLPVSYGESFFDCKAFGDWKKSRDAEAKNQAAIVDRLNTVIRAVGNVAKAMTGR